MSLQSEIYDAVKKTNPNIYRIDEVFGIAELLGHKQSLAERKCRLLVHAGLIEAVRNEKKYIIGYKYIEPKPFIILKENRQENLGFALPAYSGR